MYLWPIKIEILIQNGWMFVFRHKMVDKSCGLSIGRNSGHCPWLRPIVLNFSSLKFVSCWREIRTKKSKKYKCSLFHHWLFQSLRKKQPFHFIFPATNCVQLQKQRKSCSTISNSKLASNFSIFLVRNQTKKNTHFVYRFRPKLTQQSESFENVNWDCFPRGKCRNNSCFPRKDKLMLLENGVFG